MSDISRETCCVVAIGRDVVCTADGNPELPVPVARRIVSPSSSLLEVATDATYSPDRGSPRLLAGWVSPDAELPDGLTRRNLRSLLGAVDESAFWSAGHAFQLAHWDRSNQYCGWCGGPTKLSDGELARRCGRCGRSVYPRISPAVIVAVVRERTLLLAHNARRSHAFYSVLAGFVEPGETLEECVVREVREEVNVTVGNVRYMGSQPWPFPDALMIAFTAEYIEGEIEVDGTEIDHAYWCGPHELPNVPPRPSVARFLIDWFVKMFG